MILGDRDVGAELVASPLVDHISFTGSERAGHQIMASAAKNLCSLGLELGIFLHIIVSRTKSLHITITYQLPLSSLPISIVCILSHFVTFIIPMASLFPASISAYSHLHLHVVGGKSAAVIYSDADLDNAARWACMGVFAQSGQVCSATSRLLIHEDCFDEVVEKIHNHCQHHISIGKPLEGDQWLELVCLSHINIRGSSGQSFNHWTSLLL